MKPNYKSFQDLPYFIETLLFETSNYPLLALHQQRVNRAFAVHFPGQEPHDLQTILPGLPDKKHKVRVVYDARAATVEAVEYEMRPVRKVKLITDNAIGYAHKYADRSELRRLFETRGDADDILIIKHGMVTDSYIANPVFWTGSEWITPKTCLLNGVRRQHLILAGRVRELVISESDLTRFEKLSLVNALIDLRECVVPMEQVLR